MDGDKRGSGMELDQLRYFLAAARHGSFTRAAEELGISQPAISRSILKLEDELAAKDRLVGSHGLVRRNISHYSTLTRNLD